MTVDLAHKQQVSRVSRFTRLRWLFLDIAFGCLIAWVFWTVSPSQWATPVGLVIAALLLVAALVLPLKRQNLTCRWNEESVQVSSVLLRGKPYLWRDLHAIERSMHERATILRFGAFKKVKVHWGFEDHYSIIELAERKLEENARAS
ncbi:MAG: hypothetical protein AB8B58_01950 [Roseobacter sp.]